MEFRKKVMITLYVREQKRHRCIEKSFTQGPLTPDCQCRYIRLLFSPIPIISSQPGIIKQRHHKHQLDYKQRLLPPINKHA